MARLRGALASVLLLAGLALATAHVSAVPSYYDRSVGQATGACNTCLIATRMVSDMLCDPAAESATTRFIIKNICGMANDRKQCVDLAHQLVPVAIQWLRASATPATLCADAGVCGADIASHAKCPKAHAVRDDMQCPVCTFVVEFIKKSLADPATADEVKAKAQQACALLPADNLKAGCSAMVDQYEPLLVSIVATTDASTACQLMGACLAGLVERAPLKPLPPALLASLADIVHLQRQRSLASGPLGDACDTCKVLVTEAHAIVADPKLQSQVATYAKAMCEAVPSYEDACDGYVDTYTPLVFGMALSYLQPNPLCAQLGYCPPPSLLEALAAKASAAVQRIIHP